MGPVPRSNRRRRDDRPLPVAALEGRIDTSVTWRGSRWGVRRLAGANATRPYRCPGCEHEVAPGTPHVLVWPLDGLGGMDDRRHWHSRCWQSRETWHPRGSLR